MCSHSSHHAATLRERLCHQADNVAAVWTRFIHWSVDHGSTSSRGCYVGDRVRPGQTNRRSRPNSSLGAHQPCPQYRSGRNPSGAAPAPPQSITRRYAQQGIFPRGVLHSASPTLHARLRGTSGLQWLRMTKSCFSFPRTATLTWA